MSAPVIAAVAHPFGRDLEAALADVERIVRAARARGAGLVVLPECALGGYLHEPLPRCRHRAGPPPALDPDGPEIARLARIAGDTVLCAGYVEDAGGGRRHSSAVCLTGDGVLGRHRKVHLPPSERGAFVAGEGFAAFDTPAGRLGMLICYDKLFPEAARSLALDGAEIVASMAAWPVCRRRPARLVSRDRQTRHFNLLDEARAVENQVVWASANHSGAFGRLRFAGHAKVVDPDGRVLARTGARGGLAVAGVDAAGAVAGARGALSHLADMRPAAYRAGAAPPAVARPPAGLPEPGPAAGPSAAHAPAAWPPALTAG